MLEQYSYEWHVSEAPTNAPQEDESDLQYAVHYLLDPGDGLCSTLIEDLPKEVADHIVELHNRWVSQPYVLKEVEMLCARTLAGDKDEKTLIATLQKIIQLTQR